MYPWAASFARALNLEKSSVTGLIDRAQQRGLVERVDAKHDGRAVLVRLTPVGLELAVKLTVEVGEHIALLVAPLGRRERTRLADLVARLVAHDANRRGVDLDGR